MTEEVIEQAEAPTVKTYTQEEFDQQVNGLKAKVDELLTEKKTASQAAKEANESKLALEREAAKNSGELEKFEQSVIAKSKEATDALNGRIEQLQSKFLGAERKSVITKLSSEFNSDASELLQHYVKTEFDGEAIVTKYVDGNGELVTTDKEVFVKWLGEHPVLSALMKSTNATGGGANGNKSPNGGANGVEVNQAAENAKTKGDAVGTLNARLKGKF